MQLDTVQIWFIGLIVTVLVMPVFSLIERVMINQKKINLGRFWKTLLVAAFSALLAATWYPELIPNVPALGKLLKDADKIAEIPNVIWKWGSAALTAATPFVGAATIIFNMALTYIVDPEKRKQLLAHFK